MATTTFLFVDQVGSTEQLSRLGDTAAQQVRRALFDLLRQSTQVHGGHEVDFTGDGLFCSFESAADAVDAAVEMQQGVTSFARRRPDSGSLAIRIGLNTGEPLESEGGGHFGAAVVVASRLCAQAATGQILASALVRALVAPRARHRFTLVGELALKGIPDPVETYAVEWTPDDRRAYLPALLAAARTGPFVGRTRELDAVLRAWRRIGDGGRQLVLLSGDSGMGVTRLAAESAERLRAGGASVWASQAQGIDERLAVWAEAIEGWATSVTRAELRQAVGNSAPDLIRLDPGLARLLPAVPGPPSTDAEAATFLIADAVDAVAERWSSVEPLAVVLDRLNEVDAASLTVLRRLMHSRRGGRVMVIGCYEPSAVGASRVLRALEDVPDVVDVRLSALAEPEVRALIGAITGEPPSDSAVRAVLAESEGNPYYVLRMARSMHQQGITRRVGEAVGRAVELRSDLRLQREEIALSLRQLDDLREGMAGAAPARIDPDGTPPVPGACPYRGLLAFTAEDADTFFGRDALVAEMVAGLSVSRWLAVVGPSGSGKSSAVRAGLHPALARGALPGSAGWLRVDVRPGGRPLDALGEELAQLAGADGGEVSRELSSAPLAEVARRLLGSRRLVVHVDQFEELWTSTPVEVRSRVVDLLIEAATAPDEAVSVVVTMRADYYGRTAEHPALAARMAESQVLVPPMTPAELRAAVELPARQAGLVLEPGLAQAVVDDVAHEPGTLPLLSTAMQETWERRRGRSLTLTAYAETGGARRAIAHLADATLDSLDLRQQEIARRLLLRLAAPSRDGSDVARPAPISELVVDEETRVVLNRLVDRRLVTAGAATAQVAHEALLREWPRLRAWLDADRDGRRLHQQIATAADEWESGGRDDDVLLRGARLAAADEWRVEHADELSARECDFLDASVGLRERDLRRARRTTRRFQVLAVVLVVLLAGAGVATYLAVDSSRTAAQRADVAIARDLVNQTRTLVDRRLDTALLLAVEAYRRDPALETRGGLLTALDAAQHLTGFHRGVPEDIAASAVAKDGLVLYVLTPAGELLAFDTRDLSADPGTLATGLTEGVRLDVDPDGARAVVTGERDVRLVRLSDGTVSPPLPDSAEASATFTPDGRFVQLTVEEGTRLLDRDTGAVRHRLAQPLGASSAVRPGRDEVLVAEGEFGDRLRRRSLDGEPLAEPVPQDGNNVNHLVHSPDGRYVFAAFGDGSVSLLDGDTLEPLGTPLPPSGGDFPFEVVPAPQGETVAVRFDDGSLGIVLYHREIGLQEAFRTAPLPDGPVEPHWLDDERLLAVTGSVVAEFDLGDVSPLAEPLGLDESGGFVQALASDPESGDMFYVVDARLRQVSTDGEPQAMDVALPIDPMSGPTAIAVSPDGSLVAVLGVVPQQQTAEPTAEVESVLVFVPLGGSDEIRTWSFSATSDVPLLTFSPRGDTVAVLTGGNEVVELDARSGRPRGRAITTPEPVTAFQYSPDGRVLLVGDVGGAVRPVDLAAGSVGEAGTIEQESVVTAIASSPARDRVLVAAQERIFSADPWSGERHPGSTVETGAYLITLAVSPDGSQLAAVDDRGALRLWDLTAGRELGAPLGRDFPQGVVYAPDGGLVTSSASDLWFWDMRPESWRATACRLAGRELTADEWREFLPGESYRATCADA